MIITDFGYGNQKGNIGLLISQELEDKKNGTTVADLHLYHLVTTMGFEPIRLATPPPQDGESTSFSTWP